MSKTLFLIEAPGKLKKLSKILGADYLVRASGGHIRELAKDGDGKLGFDLDGDRVICRYVPKDDRAKKTIADLKAAVKQADRVIVATDPDREGEAIGWHLSEVLRLKNPQRVVYSEISEKAIRKALASPKTLDRDLIAAANARSVLDKLVGYRGSPLVWALQNGATSVGRVQSCVLHLLCEREKEIQNFVPQDYWVVTVTYQEGFKASYLGQSPQGESSEGDNEERDDAKEGTDEIEATRIRTEAEAQRIAQEARSHPHRVQKRETKKTYKNPPPPFITSSLQQVAGSRLGWNPEQTMQVAQKLYEGGYITYMRTDSIALDPDFCQSVREYLTQKDPTNLPDKAIAHRQSANAQGAHEAIRPTDISKASAVLKTELSDEQWDLYLLIWLRAVASQCRRAELAKVRILTQSGTAYWQAKGQSVLFLGYAKYWKDLGEDSLLPDVASGQGLTCDNVDTQAKQTQPPSRYSEARLVQVMEKKGVGRPSTYAAMVKVLKDRGYTEVQKKAIFVTERGMKVDQFMEQAFPDLISVGFTADMEGQLDAIAQGKLDWQSYICGWNKAYFEPTLRVAQGSLREYAPDRPVSDQLCSGCQQPMIVMPKTSKMRHDYLKCLTCQTVKFWNEGSQSWGSPSDKPKAEMNLSEYPCPVCTKPLAIKEYIKDGQTKKMLVCSASKGQGDKKHKDVVFFESKGRFWSKKYGEL